MEEKRRTGLRKRREIVPLLVVAVLWLDPLSSLGRWCLLNFLSCVSIVGILNRPASNIKKPSVCLMQWFTHCHHSVVTNLTVTKEGRQQTKAAWDVRDDGNVFSVSYSKESVCVLHTQTCTQTHSAECVCAWTETGLSERAGVVCVRGQSRWEER